MQIASNRTTLSGTRRLVAFRAVGWVFVALSLTAMGGIPGLLAPWVFIGNWPGHQFPEIHRWHDAQWGALFAILLALPMARLLLRPAERTLLLQYLLIATGWLVLVNAPFNPLILLGLVSGVFGPIALLAYLDPQRRRLRTLRPPSGWHLNWPLVAISLLTGAFLIGPARRWYDVQLLRAADEHSRFQHWTITATLALVLVSAGLLAATQRPGWITLGLTSGIALIYLGIAATRIPNHAGSWGSNGGWLAILAGAGYIGATLWSAAREAQRTSRRQTSPISVTPEVTTDSHHPV